MIIEIKLVNRVSKKGIPYTAVVGVCPNGKEIIISFDTKLYYIIRKECNSNG